MKYLKSFLFLLIIFTLFTACGKEALVGNRLLWIDKERVTCQSFIEQTCYLVQNKTTFSTDWELFYAPIERFDDIYEEGFVYLIEVEVIKIKNPLQDASSLKYKLINIISKQK